MRISPKKASKAYKHKAFCFYVKNEIISKNACVIWFRRLTMAVLMLKFKRNVQIQASSRDFLALFDENSSETHTGFVKQQE